MLTDEQKGILLLSGFSVLTFNGFYVGMYNGKMSLGYKTEESAWINLWRVFNKEVTGRLFPTSTLGAVVPFIGENT